MTEDSRSGVTRRGFIRAVGAAGVAGGLGVGALASVPTAEAQYTVTAVVAEAEAFTDDYAGLFVHVGGESTGELAVEDVDDCAISGWPPEDLSARDGSLIDRKGDDEVGSVPVHVYLPAGTDVSTGSLFVVNRALDCPERYVGLELEAIGAAVDVDTSTPAPAPENGSPTGGGSPTDGGSASGPGFGIAGTLAGVGGLAGVAGYLRSERDE
jgi:hypothetical protein